MSLTLPERVQHLVNSIFTQFQGRAHTEANKNGQPQNVFLDIKLGEDSKALWLKFYNEGESHVIDVPLPYVEQGIIFIEQNNVPRALCNFWLEDEQHEVDYVSAIYNILLNIPNGYIPLELTKATPYLQQMITAFSNKNAHIVANRLQRAINDVINRMPLHETAMNSFVMNQRLIIIDPEFDEMTAPQQQLDYQVRKAQKYFDRGWTSIGLSDGSLASKNYILKTDLRPMTPFGNRYHNPQRNLYSTLGMKGDEVPTVCSRSMHNLTTYGITRTGWNLFTAFVDIPDVFEDQIMVDTSLAKRYVTYTRRIQIFGKTVVKEGQSVKEGALLGVSESGDKVTFDVPCESARISKVIATKVNVGEQIAGAFNVIVEYKRYFRDGFKITNRHGNKGIVRLADLGYATDPRSGEKRKLEVIVSAKTVGKRRNYGQILEALFNNALEADGVTDQIVIEDDWQQDIDAFNGLLVQKGFREDGTWDCDTYAGKVKAVCGKVFWGCIKTPHDQVWKKDATIARNNKEVRTAGLKFSHVEMRALETIFGKDNPVTDEIMSYMQGSDNLQEILKMNASKVGEIPQGIPTLTHDQVRSVDQRHGTIVPETAISGTVVDENFVGGGFALRLPFPYQTVYDLDGELLHEGAPMGVENMTPDQRASIGKVFETSHIYVPEGTLRKCWKHASGRFGLNDLGVIVNGVVNTMKQLMADNTSDILYRIYYWTLTTYFRRISAILGTKMGEIATHAMAVRYPFSVKATASLSTTLPKNVVEIPRHMAKTLNVSNGDHVLFERFPCLGFVSLRVQKVRITDDPQCEYVIRVSGNSLVSTNLDFDGDVGYLATFHTPEARRLLKREFDNPNRTYYSAIQEMNARKGHPHTKEYALQDFRITPFTDLTNQEHAIIVEKNTGVKAQTGPVIALTYNIMRLVENSSLGKHQKDKVAIELFLEKAAQSVFEQKHGGKSLYNIVIDGVCMADVESLVEVGFKRGITEKVCAMITRKAESIGVFDLKKHHEKVLLGKVGNIVSLIVRHQHRIYFASRAMLDNIQLITALNAPAVDIPSKMFKWFMAGKMHNKPTKMDELLLQKEVDSMKSQRLRSVTEKICEAMEEVFGFTDPVQIRVASLATKCRKAMRGEYGQM